MAVLDTSEPGMTTHRIEALTDGIYAIAMTLLVLNLALPGQGIGVTQTEEVHNLLLGQAHKFFSYALSFILLAIFWINHHRQFHFIKRTDHNHLWINIVGLMFIALVPFSTSLSGDYPNETISKLFFDANLFIIGILGSLNWIYATRGYRLVDRSIDPQRVVLGKKRGLVTPLVALLAMVLSFITPSWSSCAYILIPIILWQPRLQYRRL